MSNSKNKDIIFETSPTLKPSVVLLVLVTLFTLVIIGGLLTFPIDVSGLYGENRILMNVTGILYTIVMIRIVIQIIVLRRTKYIIRADSLERETDMILRYNSRKAPIDELRGFEYSQDSIQTLLGYGSIRLLTGGTNQSLGFLAFENLPNAGKARNHIEDLIQ